MTYHGYADTDDAMGISTGTDSGIACQTVYGDTLEVELVALGESAFDWLTVAQATRLHAWLGAWLACRGASGRSDHDER